MSDNSKTLGQLEKEVDYLREQLEDIEEKQVPHEEVKKVNKHLEQINNQINKKKKENGIKDNDIISDSRKREMISTVISALVGYVSGLHLDKLIPP